MEALYGQGMIKLQIVAMILDIPTIKTDDRCRIYNELRCHDIRFNSNVPRRKDYGVTTKYVLYVYIYTHI